ncbi:hypothetical protein RF11_01554 [Thelohanellus kitauei]|uniref:Uncharacterized protein n=1 Tax=Thelohanellus kitauei TaxID=669202 RepID=A0A0C2IGI0_THEKT|nr:hypothetical protein RF11_01554 [Thelohanellus kitauei]
MCVPPFDILFQALNESINIDDSPRLLIFLRGISENSNHPNFSVNGINENFYYRRRWFSILGSKKVGLMKRIIDPIKEIDFHDQFIVLHSIIDLVVPCKGVLEMKHVTDPLVKFVNIIKSKPV